MLNHGLRAIVNLRGENSDLSWWRYERRVCETIGARHYDTMLDSRRLPTRPMLARLIDVLEEAPQPLLLKCSGGQDRTGLGSALYLIQHHGWAACEEAERQFARSPKRHQRWLKLFVSFAREDCAGDPITEWARQRYDPGRLVQWLTGHGHGDSFEGIFTSPRRSPWQL